MAILLVNHYILFKCFRQKHCKRSDIDGFEMNCDINFGETFFYEKDAFLHILRPTTLTYVYF